MSEPVTRYEHTKYPGVRFVLNDDYEAVCRERDAAVKVCEDFRRGFWEARHQLEKIEAENQQLREAVQELAGIAQRFNIGFEDCQRARALQAQWSKGTQ